jgi:hypothetical protein
LSRFAARPSRAFARLAGKSFYFVDAGQVVLGDALVAREVRRRVEPVDRRVDLALAVAGVDRGHLEALVRVVRVDVLVTLRDIVLSG